MVQQYVYIMTFMNIDTHRISILYYLAASGGELTRREINNNMLSSNIQNCESRQFYNNKIWVNDADCFICRPNTGHSPHIIDKHFQFIKNYSGSIWSGDNLAKLPWEKYEKYLLDLFGYKKKSKPVISIVIPGYNEEKTISQTLDSISRQQTKIPYEVVFVDNNCTDKTVKIVKSFSNKIKNLTIITEKIQSIGAARNAGFEIAKSETITSTDSDIILDNKWVSKVWGRFWINKKTIALVGPYIFISKGKFFNVISKSIMIIFDYLHKLFMGSFAFRGGNFTIKKEYWIKSGKFNQKISALEDVDLSLRVGKLGKIIYCHDLVALTSYRRFEGRLLQQFTKRIGAYYSRVILKDSKNNTDWETIR